MSGGHPIVNLMPYDSPTPSHALDHAALLPLFVASSPCVITVPSQMTWKN